MAYSIVNVDKTVNVVQAGINSSHIGTLYGGLKNSLGTITDNLKYANLNGSIVNPDGWCTITLSKVDDTAVKVMATVKENTTTSTRKCEVKLKYGDTQTATKVTITLAGKQEVVDPDPVESHGYQMTIGYANNFKIEDMHTVWFALTDDIQSGYGGNLLANVTTFGDTAGEWTATVDVKFNVPPGCPAYKNKNQIEESYVLPSETTKMYLYFRGTVSNNGTGNNGFGVFRATAFTSNGDNRYNGLPYMYLPLERHFTYNEDIKTYESSVFIIVTSIEYCGAA